jgi:hypothetical protein
LFVFFRVKGGDQSVQVPIPVVMISHDDGERLMKASKRAPPSSLSPASFKISIVDDERTSQGADQNMESAVDGVGGSIGGYADGDGDGDGDGNSDSGIGSRAGSARGMVKVDVERVGGDSWEEQEQWLKARLAARSKALASQGKSVIPPHRHTAKPPNRQITKLHPLTQTYTQTLTYPPTYPHLIGRPHH